MNDLIYRGIGRNRIECISTVFLDIMETSGGTEYEVFLSVSVDCLFSSEDNGTDRM